jgi:hypothetical protein
MNIKIASHIMPWDIDYALLLFTQLKKSKYYLSEDINITVDVNLNLSDYIIDWNKSKLPKSYFISKFNTLLDLLEDYNVDKLIYEGNNLYGHLDQQRSIISPETDYYISICPDIYFSEHTLYYLIESDQLIKNKYFVLSPQHRKLTDESWDPTTDENYLNIPYEKCNDLSIFDIRHNNKQKDNIAVQPVQIPKFAGWCDLYSKSFYEELVPIHDEWNGYGPWDWYSMILINYVKKFNIDFQQYTLKGPTVGDYWIGKWKDKEGLSGYYKDLIVKKDIPNQRSTFEANLENYVRKGILMLQEKGII